MLTSAMLTTRWLRSQEDESAPVGARAPEGLRAEASSASQRACAEPEAEPDEEPSVEDRPTTAEDRPLFPGRHDSLIGTRVKVWSSSRVGHVVEEDLSDSRLTYKIAFNDDLEPAADWSPQDDIMILHEDAERDSNPRRTALEAKLAQMERESREQEEKARKHEMEALRLRRQYEEQRNNLMRTYQQEPEDVDDSPNHAGLIPSLIPEGYDTESSSSSYWFLPNIACCAPTDRNGAQIR